MFHLGEGGIANKMLCLIQRKMFHFCFSKKTETFSFQDNPKLIIVPDFIGSACKQKNQLFSHGYLTSPNFMESLAVCPFHAVLLSNKTKSQCDGGYFQTSCLVQSTIGMSIFK